MVSYQLQTASQFSKSPGYLRDINSQILNGIKNLFEGQKFKEEERMFD